MAWKAYKFGFFFTIGALAAFGVLYAFIKVLRYFELSPLL